MKIIQVLFIHSFIYLTGKGAGELGWYDSINRSQTSDYNDRNYTVSKLIISKNIKRRVRNE